MNGIVREITAWAKTIAAIATALLLIATIFGAVGGFFWRLALMDVANSIDREVMRSKIVDSVLVVKLSDIEHVLKEQDVGLAQRVEQLDHRIDFLESMLKK